MPPQAPYAAPRYPQQAAPYRPGPGYPGAPSFDPQPPRRRAGGVVAIIALIVVTGMIVLGVFLSSLFDDPTPVTSSSTQTSYGQPTYTQPTTTESTTAGPMYTTEPTLPPATTAPPTSTKTQTSRTTEPVNPTARDHPAGNYFNDGYQAPASGGGPSEATDWDQVRSWRRNNSLYAQPVASPVRCEMDVIDIETATDEQTLAHLEKWTDCLTRVWGPAVEAGGDTMTRPRVSLIRAPYETPCGTIVAANAGFYCSSDEAIYMNRDFFKNVNGSRGKLIPNIETTFAHEYGHFVQGRVGIMSASWMNQRALEGYESQMKESRARELQAQCFNGIAIGALRQSMGFTEQDMKDFYKWEHRTADDEHGTSERQADWWRVGTQAKTVGECNTFGN